MQNIRLPRRFATLAFTFLAAGCTLGGNSLADQQSANIATFSSPLSYQVYNVLAAEIYARDGDTEHAALHYMAAAQQSNDPAIAQRATEIAVDAGDAKLAGRALERWLELAPDSKEARQYRALIKLRAGRYDEAAKDLASVRDEVQKKEGQGFEFIMSLLALEPDQTRAYETLKRYVEKEDGSARAQLVFATLALNADHPEDALKAAETARRTGDKAQKEQAIRLSAKALMALQRVDEALAELKPLAGKSADVDLKLDYARMLILADRREEATPLFKQLYASQPENADILYTLGLLYLEQKEYAFAEPLIKKLLKIPGRKEDASYFLGQIYEGQKRPREAVEAYKQAIGGNMDGEAIARAAQLMNDTQGVDKAREWLAQQLKDTQENKRKTLLLILEGQILHTAKRYDESIKAYDEALKLSPDNVEIFYDRSLNYEKKGDIARAEADLKDLLKKEPDHATALNALGYMLTVNGQRYDEAFKLIDKARKIRPDDPAIMDSMGWVLYRMGKTEEAETWLRKAYAGLQDPEVIAHLLEVLKVRGKTTEAKTILQEMLGKFPDDQQLKKIKETLVGL